MRLSSRATVAPPIVRGTLPIPIWPVTSLRSWFFFSSRRRHTRSLRDWSSDVCSSDLDVGNNAVKALEGRAAALIANHGLVAIGPRPDKVLHVTALIERTAQISWGARALEIGRASCRERVQIWVAAGGVEKSRVTSESV